jgi:hypothetical protein
LQLCTGIQQEPSPSLPAQAVLELHAAAVSQCGRLKAQCGRLVQGKVRHEAAMPSA